MSKLFFKLSSFLILFSLISLPTVFAQPSGSGTNPPSGEGINTQTITIENPLGEGATFATLMSNIVDFLVVLAIPILTLMVLYAAFLMLTAGGKEEQFKKGRQTLLYAAIGFVIILIGEGLVKLIEVIIVGNASLSN